MPKQLFKPTCDSAASGFFFAPNVPDYGICRDFVCFVAEKNPLDKPILATLRKKEPKEKGFKKCVFLPSGMLRVSVRDSKENFAVCMVERLVLKDLGIGTDLQKTFWIKIQILP